MKKRLLLVFSSLALLTACGGFEGEWEATKKDESGCADGFIFSGDNTVTVQGGSEAFGSVAQWKDIGDDKYRLDFGFAYQVLNIERDKNRLKVQAVGESKVCTYKKAD
ncbi:hypothetical protein [Desmospora activa]|uniref:hypothetical protein n=1 Tax=Desmospora activa TaxID=500615 RepID=UPI0011B26568|nr:hypothetical protein [Desmospora activa]